MQKKLLLLLCVAGVAISCDDSEGTPGTDLIGKSGSLARFALTATHLFAVDDESLNVYQIMEDGSLEKVNTADLGSGVETIFTKDHWLYIGTNSAMVTYDIINPASPVYVSAYSHFVACDPVVVQDTLAFVTMRTTECRTTNFNALDIINIKDPQSPRLVSQYVLDSPYGLGVDDNLLFVCEGEMGLKIFDVSNPFNAMLVKSYKDVNAFDVIPNEGVLILTGQDGIMQYDYSDQNAIRKISTISVQQ
jgi:hypothetical protein